MAVGSSSPTTPATQILRRSLERGRIGHAYLLTGESLTELEDLARALAQALNCVAPAKKDSGLGSCGRCSNCLRIEHYNHPDVLWIRPESKLRIITISQVREVLGTVNLKPSEAAWKVMIFVAADRMKTEAANAFLKTLEEPPARSLMILLSTEPQRLLPTILSRCLRLPVQAGQTSPASNDWRWLQSFSAEVSTPHKSRLHRYVLLDGLLTRLAEIRDAVEQELRASSLLETHDDLDPALRDELEDELNASVEAEYRKRRADLLNLLHWWLRDVWVIRQTQSLTHQRFEPLAAAAGTLSNRLSPLQALENLQTLERTRRLLESNVQEALALEVGLLKLNL